MRKVVLAFVAVASFFVFSAEAQQSTFEKGSAVLDFTIGSPTSSGTTNRDVLMPPVSMTLDFGGPSGFFGGSKGKSKGGKNGAKSSGGKGALGFGGIASFYYDDCWGWEDDYWHNGYHYNGRWPYDATVFNMFLAFRFSFHYEVVESMDLYGGLLMGGRFRIWNYVEPYNYESYTGEHPIGSKFCFGPFVGMRYYFGDVFGLKAEFGVDTGAGLPNAQGGICLKLK
ncbi:MAG: hypothetical protein J6Q03_05040 [Paludibacteraceae bacterium]|jgi:hypothetical protein|nr:hypothetical protein [Paludibacteraceae bacterium]MEE0996574.1 hypothetical protein [Paludibacteraceae bacterium]